MIESTASYSGTYYYHFDALGSVVALTNSSGNTVQVYDYSVYGQVGASDADHPNRFMFTGREFDKETGLYFYRARYYNPQIGRFLQVDPVGYGAGMNLYRYCHNNPWNRIDPWGLYDGNDSNDYDSNDSNSVGTNPGPPGNDPPKPPDCTKELIAYTEASLDYIEKENLETQAKEHMDNAWETVKSRSSTLAATTIAVGLAKWNVAIKCGKWYSWRRATPACRLAMVELVLAGTAEAAAVWYLGKAVAEHQMAVTAYVPARDAARDASTRKDQAKDALEKCLGHPLEGG